MKDSRGIIIAMGFLIGALITLVLVLASRNLTSLPVTGVVAGQTASPTRPRASCLEQAGRRIAAMGRMIAVIPGDCHYHVADRDPPFANVPGTVSAECCDL